MKKLFDWYITRHSVYTDDIKALRGIEYLGKEECFYYAHGRIIKETEPSGTKRKRSSVIKKLEFFEDSGLLVIHSVNSIYSCHIDDCRRERQEPLDVLPEPVRAIAAARLYPLIHATKEPNTILLAFDENDNDLNYVDAGYNRDGYTSRLDAYPHLGMFTDSVLIYDESLGRSEIDIRYFPTASSRQGAIEFYSFDTDGFSVYLYNVGEAPLTFKTPVGTIKLAPGEKKLVSKENASPRMRRKYWHRRKHCCRSCPVYWVKIKSEALEVVDNEIYCFN